MDLFSLFSECEIALIAKACDFYFYSLGSSKDTLSDDEEKTLDALAEISDILHSVS